MSLAEEGEQPAAPAVEAEAAQQADDLCMASGFKLELGGDVEDLEGIEDDL